MSHTIACRNIDRRRGCLAQHTIMKFFCGVCCVCANIDRQRTSHSLKGDVGCNILLVFICIVNIEDKVVEVEVVCVAKVFTHHTLLGCKVRQ